MSSNKLKKYLLLSITFTLLSSCFRDVIEKFEVKEINLNTIEEITSNSNKNIYSKIQSDSTFPIVAWLGVPQTHTTIERFTELRNAGININYSKYANADSLEKALNIAELVGVKVMISCPELLSDTEKTVKRFINHPANGGYFLFDEPLINEFSRLESLVKKIESIDSTRFCYINLLPNVSTPELYSYADYTRYISDFLNQVPVKILSFDHYPIIKGGIRINWYQNLEIIRNETLKANLPFWAFALTTAHDPYPVPDLSHLRLQVYSNLAYGAKGIQYFTYWTNNSYRYVFYNGPIEKDGSQTSVYDYVKQMNNEIRTYSKIFANSKTTKVSHFGNVPQGASKFESLPNFINKIEIKNGNALLAEMNDGTDSYFIIQNSTLDREIGIRIETDTETKVILKDGYIIPASTIKDGFKLTPGDIVLFMR
jgi:hypothetical protein